MLVGSGAVITKRHTEYAVAGLLGVVIIQGFGYGLIFDLNFFPRNTSSNPALPRCAGGGRSPPPRMGLSLLLRTPR